MNEFLSVWVVIFLSYLGVFAIGWLCGDLYGRSVAAATCAPEPMAESEVDTDPPRFAEPDEHWLGVDPDAWKA